MAGSRFLVGYGFVAISNSGFILRHGYKVAWPAFIRISALLGADIISSFAMFAMMNYLTDVWNLSTTHAAGIINIFYGITTVLFIVFIFFVDAFLGDFYMLVLCSIAYTAGLVLLSLSTPPFFGPCSQYKEECIRQIQRVTFFTALPLIQAGIAGQYVSTTNFLFQQIESEAVDVGAYEAEVEAAAASAEAVAAAVDAVVAKFEAETEEEEVNTEVLAAAEAAAALAAAAAVADEGIAAVEEIFDKAEAETPIIFSQRKGLMFMVPVMIVGGIALPYIKPWSIRFGIPAICALTATMLFLTGSPRYKHSKPEGSPLIIALRVFVAAATKDFQQVTNFKQVYNDDDTPSTSNLRWLDKAAIKFPDQAMSKSWTLCSVREVEDTKTGILMVPMLLTFIGVGVVLSLRNTYFLDQANHMERKLGSIKIEIPIFLLVYYSSTIISQRIYALLMKWIAIPERYYAPTEIAVGMFLSVVCCITAAIVETQRLHVISNHGLPDEANERIQMSVFYLLPQFLLLAAVDGIITSGISRFLSKQVPELMHTCLLHFVKFVLGLGRMANVFWVYVVGKLSERNNNPNWFQHTSDKSRLDRYYWTLAGLSTVNLVMYAIVASFYNYKETSLDNDDDDDDDELEG